MPYESDREVLAWFERALADERPMVRRRAVELLEYVDCAHRSQWLDIAERDPEPRVAATAALVGAVIRCQADLAALELLESDFSDECSDDLEWEWEYNLRVCRGMSVPASSVLAWTRCEDDATARHLALMKLFPGQVPDKDAVAVIIGKRLVNRYTRSPRNQAEAMLWHQRGRPRYEGP